MDNTKRPPTSTLSHNSKRNSKIREVLEKSEGGLMVSYWWLGKMAVGIALITNCFFLQSLPSTLLPGQCLVALGAVVHLYHFYLLKKGNEKIDPPTKLITEGGLFSKIRHPMYVGDSLIMLGLILVNPQTWALAAYAFALLCLYQQKRVEDRKLEAIFPDEYREYRLKTWF